MIESPNASRVLLKLCTLTACLLAGCGASAPSLWEAGRFPEACREMEYAETPQFLDALYAQSGLSVHVHAYSAEELEAMLPAVPRVLLGGNHTLLGIRAEVQHDVGGWLELSAVPRLEGRAFRLEPYCDPVQQALAPGREPEVEPEGWMARMTRGVRVLGGSAVASVADVVWAATAGTVDARPGSLEDGVITLRNLGEAVVSAEADDGTSPANTADDEAERRALEQRSAEVLDEMLSGTYCRIEGTTSCTHFALYHTDLQSMTGADLQIIVSYNEGDLPDRCYVGEAWVAGLEGSGVDRAAEINSLFADGPTTFPNPAYTRTHP